ncbi:Arf-GAP with ANK repeat and PH domain-containing protein cnt-1 [Hondaea fermentalgiana]|uniref:Arf-GAP with ANK repeat and PH domain-containing protein cnt-1 n=1 Tax=Hondaea fermentalgiana TaxID=2315210 RepID=A0A2R5GJ91_9STRA|nr:Arf-GAP with ANK repeat and PH domain-containing protein cnt-1 [Hondaea fermentalgiana]|eukprot:GBG30950.1 Arf-GAP with ANK repeat and PH domain-containing protein cnt-1 [Hondaea fermentalgiana]
MGNDGEGVLHKVAQELLRELDEEGAKVQDWTPDQVARFCAVQSASEDSSMTRDAADSEEAATGAANASWTPAAQAMRKDLLDSRSSGSPASGLRMEIGERANGELSSPRLSKPRTHSGYVDKRASTSWSHWNRRFFALKGTKLQYFRDRADLDPRKSFYITTETVAFPVAARKHCVEVRNMRGASRPLVIRCEDEASAESWLAAFDATIRELASATDSEDAVGASV